MSILVPNKVCRYFWSVVLWWKFKIRECVEPYCEHEVQRFLFNVYKRFFILVTFFTFFNVFCFNLNVFYIYELSLLSRRLYIHSMTAWWAIGIIM